MIGVYWPRPLVLATTFKRFLKDGHFYALAGRNIGKEPENTFDGTISENDAYDIKKDSWTTLPNDIPTERAGTAAILYKENILIVGGKSQSQETAHAEMEIASGI